MGADGDVSLRYEAVGGQLQFQRLIGGGPAVSRQATCLVMVETPSRTQTDLICTAIVDRVIPGLWSAIEHPDAAEAMLQELFDSGPGTPHISVAAIQWPRCLLISNGGQRVALVRKRSARIIQGGPRNSTQVLADDLQTGDRLVLMAESTGAVLPMPAIGLASRNLPSAGQLAHDLVAQAVMIDPIGPHAVLGVLVGSEQR